MAEAVLELIKIQTDTLKLLAEKFGEQQKNGNNGIPLPAPFNVEKGDLGKNFEYFVKSWENYVVASGMNKWSNNEEQKKVHTLLTAIGERAMIKYNHFNLTTDNKKNCQTLIAAIRKIIIGKKNIIYDRAIFNSANQSDNESFEEYLVRLQSLIEACDFGTFADDLLRDRIVIGIKNRDMKRKLMSKADLTLEQAIEICKSVK